MNKNIIIATVFAIGIIAGAWYLAQPSIEEIAERKCMQILHVIDGDTFKIAPKGQTGRQYTLRIADIDAPEMGTEAGRKARYMAGELVGGECVRLITDGKYGKYDRLLGDIYIGNGIRFSDYMVANGYARRWVE